MSALVTASASDRDADPAIEWIGGQPIGETILRRVNRTTARTIIEVDLPNLPAPAARDVEVWVENQMFSMPFHVKIGVAVVAMVITLHAVLRNGRVQWRLPAPARRHMLECWSRSPLPPVSQYVRLVRSLAIFAAYEHPAGLRRNTTS